MAKARRAPKGTPAGRVLSDNDWIIAISALLRDSSAESNTLAKRLLAQTKHGRHMRMLRLLVRQKPTMQDLVKALKVSRRTVFRDLNNLEDYGVQLRIGDKFRYEIAQIPANLKKLF
jgi:biotin operon repressor